jgi:hypothetical protein
VLIVIGVWILRNGLTSSRVRSAVGVRSPIFAASCLQARHAKAVPRSAHTLHEWLEQLPNAIQHCTVCNATMSSSGLNDAGVGNALVSRSPLLRNAGETLSPLSRE